MAKLKRKKDIHEDANLSKANDAKELTVIGNANNIDPELDALFTSSFGPVVSPPKPFRGNSLPAQEDPAGQGPPPIGPNKDERGLLRRQSKALTEDAYSARPVETSLSQDGDIFNVKTVNFPDISKNKKLTRKRKRDSKEEVEDIYMKRLALEELRSEKLKEGEEKALQHEIATDVPKRDARSSSSSSTSSNPARERLFEVEYSSRTLQHESTLTSESSLEIEKSSRTVFLGNVSIEAILSKSAKKILINHLSSFLPSLPSESPGKVMHQVESIRFRSTAFSSRVLPKKAAFAKKELMDATTKSTNAYAVYTTAIAAKEAVKRLNGTIVLGRHLRVDGVASPATTDPRRCVFVGNLSFVDDESAIETGQSDSPKVVSKKKKQPADVEEGLWVQFGKVGKVESVRVVRDATTRVGKGFAYVQFKDANAVEAALLLNDKKYPPLLPRKLRVTRAKPITKNAQGLSSQNSKIFPRKANPNHTNIANTRQGVRNANTSTSKLLGRAGAAKARPPLEKRLRRSRDGSFMNTPEQFVFEGHRASSKGVGTGTKKRIAGGKAKAKGKPQTRSSRRGTAWKADGSKKA